MQQYSLYLTKNGYEWCSGAFWLYSGFAFIGMIVFALCLPETKGKPLEEVEHLFSEPLFSCRHCRTATYTRMQEWWLHDRGLFLPMLSSLLSPNSNTIVTCISGCDGCWICVKWNVYFRWRCFKLLLHSCLHLLFLTLYHSVGCAVILAAHFRYYYIVIKNELIEVTQSWRHYRGTLCAVTLINASRLILQFHVCDYCNLHNFHPFACIVWSLVKRFQITFRFFSGHMPTVLFTLCCWPHSDSWFGTAASVQVCKNMGIGLSGSILAESVCEGASCKWYTLTDYDIW